MVTEWKKKDCKRSYFSEYHSDKNNRSGPTVKCAEELRKYYDIENWITSCGTTEKKGLNKETTADISPPKKKNKEVNYSDLPCNSRKSNKRVE